MAFHPNSKTNMTQRKLTYPEYEKIVAKVRFYDWRFVPSEIGEKEGFFVQISADETDNRSGEPMTWKGRKWLVSRFSTESEIIQTCWLAVQIARQHEDRENFFYEGKAILGPHFDVKDLAARMPQEDLRETMTPKGAI